MADFRFDERQELRCRTVRRFLRYSESDNPEMTAILREQLGYT